MVCVHGACVVRRASSPKGRGGVLVRTGLLVKKGYRLGSLAVPTPSHSRSLPITPPPKPPRRLDYAI